MPSAIRVIDRFEDLADVDWSSVSDGEIMIYDSATGKLVGEARVLVDTEANILAATPEGAALAFATDTERLYAYAGSAWRVTAIPLVTETTAPDMGAYNEDYLGPSGRQGYELDAISDKRLSHCLVGYSGRAEEGSLRSNNGYLQVYLNAVWNDVVINFVLREDSAGGYEFEHQPVGFDSWIEIMTGNSDTLGLNGLPLIQQYTASMGAYPVPVVINGGTF